MGQPSFNDGPLVGVEVPVRGTCAEARFRASSDPARAMGKEGCGSGERAAGRDAGTWVCGWSLEKGNTGLGEVSV